MVLSCRGWEEEDNIKELANETLIKCWQGKDSDHE